MLLRSLLKGTRIISRFFVFASITWAVISLCYIGITHIVSHHVTIVSEHYNTAKSAKVIITQESDEGAWSGFYYSVYLYKTDQKVSYREPILIVYKSIPIVRWKTNTDLYLIANNSTICRYTNVNNTVH